MDTLREERVCEVFGIDRLYDHQMKTLTAVLEKKDVFLSTKTSSGKSLCYQAAPLMFDDGNAVVIVVSPLISIMKEQVLFLNAMGFSSTYIGKDERENTDIENGHYTFVFSSPENLLGNERWRSAMLSNRSKLRLIVIDEAHTMLQWGESHGAEKPFREWFGHIGEIRSLCPGTPVMVLTATAGPRNREKIYRKLCLVEPVEIIENPDRPNIKLFMKRVKSTDNLGDIFHWMIDGLKKQGQHFPRHILFCKRISECARVFNTFRRHLGNDFSGSEAPYNMYHSCTRDHVKQAIASDMNNENGNIRVLICTNAAGMGVNFKGISQVVNFGPPVELDTFIQQIGRAGRDGSPSQHILIFNRRQLKKVDGEVMTYTKNDEKCRRKVLCSNYTSDMNTSIEGHQCCDICSVRCNCGEIECKSETFEHNALIPYEENSDSDDDDDDNDDEFSDNEYYDESDDDAVYKWDEN